VLSGGTINGAAQAADVRRLQALTPHDPSRLDVERVLTGTYYPRRLAQADPGKADSQDIKADQPGRLVA
jgi:hypothetical protein